jgi:hypothetical protein
MPENAWVIIAPGKGYIARDFGTPTYDPSNVPITTNPPKAVRSTIGATFA